jgi:hypothetical protein
MNTNHTCASRQKLFSAKFVAKATIAAATALTAAGFLAVPTPAQARPMIPLAPLSPACTSYLWPGGGVFSINAGNGTDTAVSTSQDYVVGRAFYTPVGAPGPANATYGNPSGGIVGGTSIDITINWDQGPGAGYASHFTGKINDEGLASGTVHNSNRDDNWSSPQKFSCITQAPPPAPAPAPAARLGVSVNGPTTLPAGQSGTYTVNVSNPGDVSAPVELYASFNGKLQQTGQVSPSGGFNCDVQNYAGGTSSVHCTVGQFQPKATAAIVVQGRGSAPGAGGLDVNINSSDPAAQFVQKSQKLNVTIT